MRFNQVVFGKFRLDHAEGALWNGQARMRLRPKPFAVLEYLARNVGRLVTKEELLYRTRFLGHTFALRGMA